MASAIVASPRFSCHRAIGSWLVTMVDRRPARSSITSEHRRPRAARGHSDLRGAGRPDTVESLARDDLVRRGWPRRRRPLRDPSALPKQSGALGSRPDEPDGSPACECRSCCGDPAAHCADGWQRGGPGRRPRSRSQRGGRRPARRRVDRERCSSGARSRRGSRCRPWPASRSRTRRAGSGASGEPAGRSSRRRFSGCLRAFGRAGCSAIPGALTVEPYRSACGPEGAGT